MNILLINPNRFSNPPVIPIGLEYIAASIEQTKNHLIKILDLCFSNNPSEDLKQALLDKNYNLVGFTVRNIDSVIYKKNEFYLIEIAKLINIVRPKNIPIVIGGASCDADPIGLKEFLNVDYLIFGPGDVAILKLIESLENKIKINPIINGWEIGINPDLSRNPLKYFNYMQYFDKGGIAAFQTQVGCNGNCHFCFEKCTQISSRNPTIVIDDIITIIKSGFNDFHLADTEFNQNLVDSEKFLQILDEKLTKSRLKMNWAIYIKPKPVSKHLFDLFKKTGLNLITLSIESSEEMQRRNNYSFDDIDIIFELAKDRGIKIAIDMISGAPTETIRELEKAIRFFKLNPPKRVGINIIYRIYKNTDIYKYIVENIDNQKGYLLNSVDSIKNPIIPIFYKKFNENEIMEIIGDDPLFKMEGEESGVNYQRT